MSNNIVVTEGFVKYFCNKHNQPESWFDTIDSDLFMADLQLWKIAVECTEDAIREQVNKETIKYVNKFIEAFKAEQERSVKTKH